LNGNEDCNILFVLPTKNKSKEVKKENEEMKYEVDE
jgi:hypothetical protein